MPGSKRAYLLPVLSLTAISLGLVFVLVLLEESGISVQSVSTRTLVSIGLVLALTAGILLWICLRIPRVIRQSELYQHEMEKLLVVLDSMNDTTLILDNQGKVLHWPKSAVRMFGYDEKKGMKKRVDELVHSEVDKKFILKGLRSIDKSTGGGLTDGPQQFLAVDASRNQFPCEHMYNLVQMGGADRIVLTIRDISRRKAVEESLIKSESRLRDAQQIANLGNWELTFPDRALYVSEEGSSVFGLDETVNVFSLKKFLRLIHPGDLKAVRESHKEWLRAKKGTYDFTYRIRLDGGTVKTIHQIGRPVLDEAGNIQKLVGTVQDITHRRRREQELQLISERFQIATESAMVGVWDWDLARDHLFWSDTMFNLYGIDKSDFTWDYDGWRSMIYPDDMEETEARLSSAVSIGCAFHTVFRIRKKDGEIRHLEVTAKPASDMTGKTERMVGTSVDITSQVEANQILKSFNEELEHRIRSRTIDLEKANRVTLSILRDANRSKKSAEDALERLRLSQAELQKLSLAVQSSPAVVMIMDAEWTIEYVNPRFTELTGYAAEEVLGRQAGFLKPGEQSSASEKAIGEKLANGEIWNGELQTRRKDGSVFWEFASFSPILDENRHVSHYVSVKEDMTRQKEVQAKLEEALQQVKMASNAKSEFLASMSHEIRTPMNAILGFTDILDRQLVESIHRRYLNSIKSSGRLLLSLINDILDLSKVEAGKLSMSYASIDLKKLLFDMQLVFAQKIQEKEIDFEIDIGDNVPHALVLDETRIRQVLVNLIGNAFKFTENGQIKVSAHAQFNESSKETLTLEIRIRDTGIGIPQDVQEKIFSAFEQVTNKGSSNLEGTGLGLTISKNLVELMNGSISVESAPDKGSTFTVILNEVEISDEIDLPLPSEEAANSDRIIFQPATLLIADDVANNRDLIKGYLEEFPFEYIEADNGEDACMLTSDNSPDIVLMDLKMHHLNGLEATQRIKESSKTGDIPVVALTASVMSDDSKRFQKISDAFIQKPVSKEELVERLSHFLPHSLKDEPVEQDDVCILDWEPTFSADEVEIYLEYAETLQEHARTATALGKSMAMDKLEAFAADLESFATANSLHKLTGVAKSLQDQVLMFELDNIRSILNAIIELSSKVRK